MERRRVRRLGGSYAGIWLTGVGLLFAMAGVGVWSGCSVTKGNYQVLRFFFDGVPDPNLPAGAVGKGAGGTAVFVVVHKPFAEEKCEACHKTRYRPSRSDSSICLQCHEAVRTEHPQMHGPVAMAACLWCHNPHEASHPALLRDDDRKVCAQCHSAEMLENARVPAHADASRACLECHSGHGGAARYMLKGAASAPSPAHEPEPPGAPPGVK